MNGQRILLGTSALLLATGTAVSGDFSFPALGKAVSDTAAAPSRLDDSGLAAIEAGEDLGAKITQTVANALKQANAAKTMALKLAGSGKPLAPGYLYVFRNGKLMRKEKLAGNTTIIRSVSGTTRSVFTTRQALTVQSLNSVNAISSTIIR